MAKADYYKGLESHFDEQERTEHAMAQSAHGMASMHPMNAYRHNHEPKTPVKMTPKEAHKLGKLTIRRSNG